jgi:hypothetical protein
MDRRVKGGCGKKHCVSNVTKNPGIKVAREKPELISVRVWRI